VSLHLQFADTTIVNICAKLVVRGPYTRSRALW